MSATRLDVLGSIAFVVHGLLTGAIYSQHFEGSWGGFLLFVVDFPASLLFFIPGISGSWLAMAIVGGLWWYVVAISVRKFVRKWSQHN